MCKDVVNKDSTCQSIFRRLCIAKKIEDFRFPVSRPDDMSSRPDDMSSRPDDMSSRPDDMSSRPDAHLSTIPSVQTTCHPRPNARQTSIIHPDDVSFRLDPPLYREASVPACIRPDISTARPDVHQ
jgi:hypothetical protein